MQGPQRDPSPGLRRTFPPTEEAVLGVLKALAARKPSGHSIREDGWVAVRGSDLVAAFREEHLDDLCEVLQELHKDEVIIADSMFVGSDFLEEVDSPDFSPSVYDTESTHLGSFDYLIQGPRELKDVATHLPRIGFNEIEQVLRELFENPRRKGVEEGELQEVFGLTERKGVGVWWVPDFIYGSRGRIDAPPAEDAPRLFSDLLDRMKERGWIQPVTRNSFAPNEYARFRQYGVLRVLRSLPGPDADQAFGPTRLAEITELSKSAVHQNLQTLVKVGLVKHTDSGYHREPVSLRGCVLLELEEDLVSDPESRMRVDKALALPDDPQAKERSKDGEDAAQDDDVILGHLDDATLLAVLDELRVWGYLEPASAPEGTHPRIPAPDDDNPQSLNQDCRIRPTPRALALLGRCPVCRELVQEGIAVRMGDRSSPHLSFPLHETCAESIPEDEEERRRFTWPASESWCGNCNRYLSLPYSLEVVEIERDEPPGQTPSSRDLAKDGFGRLPRWVHKECPPPPRDTDR